MDKLPPLPKSSMKLPPLVSSPVKVGKKAKTVNKKTLPPLSKKPISTLPPLPKSSINLPPLVSSSVATKGIKSIPEGKGLTGIKDVDFIILSELNDKDLFSLCLVDKSINKLCKDETFWKNRFLNRFGDMAAKYKPQNRSWRNHYLKVISDLDKYSSDPWEFLKGISWVIYNPPTNTNVRHISDGTKNIKNAKEAVKNQYWLLELGKDITLEFPVDRYGELDYVKRRYTSDKEFTPAKVLQLVYDFYQEPITREELEMMQEEDIEFAEDHELEDAEKGNVKRIDFMGDLQFFEGFTKEGDVYNLSLGS